MMEGSKRRGHREGCTASEQVWSLNLRLSSACFLVLDVETETEDGEETPAKTQALRSHTTDNYTSKWASHLLPIQYIIYKHEKYRWDIQPEKIKIKTDSVWNTAGKLLLAARRRKDESLLLHIHDRGLMAREAWYHFTSFRGHTQCLSKNKNEKTESNLYESRYKYFSETVIEEKFLKKREVLRLSKLNMLFKDSTRKGGSQHYNIQSSLTKNFKSHILS